MKRLSIVIPAYNEARTILQVLGEIRRQRVDGVEFEIIVVDDGSTDGTAALIKENSGLVDRLIERRSNGGKGAAVKDGLSAANGDFVLFQDADLEYSPEDYPRLLKPALEFGADLVIGSRLTAPPYTRVYYFFHLLGNKFLTFVFNVFNNTTFTDIYSCYLLYRRELIAPSGLKTRGWDQQAEILSRLVRRGRVFYEVPISYRGRTYDEGKKIRAIHALQVILAIVRFRLF